MSTAGSHDNTQELSWLRGNEKDFSLLYVRYQPLLQGIALSFLKANEASNDIVQDVFLSLWNKRFNLEIIEVRPYLFRMIRNRCLDYLRKNKDLEELSQAEESEASQNSESELIGKETGRKIVDLIQALSPQCRTVFLLVRFEQLKYREVAELLCLSEKTVENHMGRALKALRSGISESGGITPIYLFALFAFDFQEASFFLTRHWG